MFFILFTAIPTRSNLTKRSHEMHEKLHLSNNSRSAINNGQMFQLELLKQKLFKFHNQNSVMPAKACPTKTNIFNGSFKKLNNWQVP